MEASIMSGTYLDVGAVTLLKDFLNPISISRKVLTDSPHSLLGADGAKTFALEKVSDSRFFLLSCFLCFKSFTVLFVFQGFETVPRDSLISPHAKNALEQFLKHGEFGRTEIGTSDVPTYLFIYCLTSILTY